MRLTIHFPIIISIILSVLCVVLARDSCEQEIRVDTIEDSWQSSSYLRACFKGSRSGFIEPMKDTYNYFHTEVSKSAAKNGFHWFVVKLKYMMHISSVSIKNRDTKHTAKSLENILKSRSADIEIWMSQKNHLNFGNEHCEARSISSQFSSTSSDWTLCGKTPSISGIVPGYTQSLHCWPPIQTRYILLKKKVDDENLCMSFVNMGITQEPIKAEIVPSKTLVALESDFTVKCTKQCTAAVSASEQVCSPNDKCLSQSYLLIQGAQPKHSGTYTCRVGGQVKSSVFVKVQHPPTQLNITPTGPVSCGHLSTSRSQPAAFQVESPVTEPPSVHECSVRDNTSGKSLDMWLISSEKNTGSLRSDWRCDNCSNAARLNVTCTARQSNGRSISASWLCEPAESVNIRFRKSEELLSNMDVHFELVSSAASPEPVHSCNVTTAGGQIVQTTNWLPVIKGEKGAVRSTWSAIAYMPGQKVEQLTISCTVSAPNAWSKYAKSVWHKPKQEQPGMSAWAFAGPIVGVLLTITLAAVCLCICMKLRNLGLSDLIQASAVGTRHAMQCLSVANYHVPGMYDNAETYNPDVYDCVQKVDGANSAANKPDDEVYEAVQRIEDMSNRETLDEVYM